MSSMKRIRWDWSRTPSFSFPKPPLPALPQSLLTRPKCNFPAKSGTRRCAWDLSLGTWWISLALRCDRMLSDSIRLSTAFWPCPFERREGILGALGGLCGETLDPSGAHCFTRRQRLEQYHLLDLAASLPLMLALAPRKFSCKSTELSRTSAAKRVVYHARGAEGRRFRF